MYSAYQFPNLSDNVNFQYMTNHNLVGGLGGASQHGPNKTFGQIQYAKPPEHSLPAKQATCITVDSSSLGSNVTFLYDCSNLDLLKLMLMVLISFNAASWLFLTNACQ